MTETSEKNLGGRPPIYNDEFHPQEIIYLMSQGKFAVEVAHAWKITKGCLYRWRHEHPKFNDAFTRAEHARTAFYLEVGRSGMMTTKEIVFNDRIFAMMMKYDGSQLEERIVPLPELASCKTFNEQATIIMGALASGKISLKEANGYVDIIGKMARVDEVTELRRMLEEIQDAQKRGK